MGIYNGPSIYNQGGGVGGGGGYHDGGQIVDAEFMKVENNAVSSYDNTSRDPINFYFEPADGEILNAIVELTTYVNSTVNVYILQNGFYIPLGNIGGDTVNAGDEYKVNITGDSFSIEQVTGGGNSYVLPVGGRNYKIVKIDNLWWTTENLDWKFPGLVVGSGESGTESRANYYQNNESTHGINGDRWGLLYNTKAIDSLKNVNFASGFRIPTKTDYQNLIAGKTGISLISTLYGGSDLYGFNGTLSGLFVGGSFVGSNDEFYLWCQEQAYFFDIKLSGFSDGYTSATNGMSVRLCCDA